MPYLKSVWALVQVPLVPVLGSAEQGNSMSFGLNDKELKTIEDQIGYAPRPASPPSATKGVEPRHHPRSVWQSPFRVLCVLSRYTFKQKLLLRQASLEEDLTFAECHMWPFPATQRCTGF